MKIKINEEQTFCEKVMQEGVNPKAFASALIDELLKREILFDDNSCYGWTLGSAMHPDTQVKDVVEAIAKAGIPNVQYPTFIQIMVVKLYGDYDCPNCGCEMSVEAHRGACVGGDGYETEREYEEIIDKRVCPNCGHVLYE